MTAIGSAAILSSITPASPGSRLAAEQATTIIGEVKASGMIVPPATAAA